MNRFPETRVSLVLRLRQPEDVAAWQEFAEIYTPALLGLALRKGLQPADAEDVVQEILFAITRAIEKFQPDASRARFRTWLSRIARNLMADFCWKKRQLKSPQSLSDSRLAEGHANLAMPCSIEADFAEEYRKAVFQLAASRVQTRVSELTWRAFELTAIQGKEAEVVATEVGLSVGNIYVVRCRVLKMLRTEVLSIERSESGELETIPENESRLRQEVQE